jgi:D-serine dehydratase
MNTFLTDPIISGIKEHLLRIKHFAKNAKRAKKQESKFRNLIAAIYPSRAIAELMFECSDKKLIDQSRDDLKKWFEEEISFFLLIEKIRIHDFHRFGCLPPSNKYKTSFIGGPITNTSVIK